MARIVWTKHAEERQKQWQIKLGITRDEVERILNAPDQVVAGDQGILIAQSNRRSGLMRVAFTEAGTVKKIITLYWTSKVKKYRRAE